VAAPGAVVAGSRGEGFVVALGGAANLIDVAACTTRLRLVIGDQALVDERALKALGSRGMIWPAPGALQVVLGPIADQVAGEMRGFLKQAPVVIAPATVSPVTFVERRPAPPAISGDIDRLLAALGGASNIRDLTVASSRLCLTVESTDAAAENDLRAFGARGVVKVSATSLHVIIGPNAQATADALKTRIAAVPA